MLLKSYIILVDGFASASAGPPPYFSVFVGLHFFMSDICTLTPAVIIFYTQYLQKKYILNDSHFPFIYIVYLQIFLIIKFPYKKHVS